MKQQTNKFRFWGKARPLETRPIKLFADTDRDGVMNVFDCQPFNKRKQDSEDIGTKLKRIGEAEEKEMHEHDLYTNSRLQEDKEFKRRMKKNPEQ